MGGVFGLKGDVLWDWGQGAHNHKRQARDRCTQDRRAKTDERMGAWKDGALHVGRQGKAVPVILAKLSGSEGPVG